MTKHDENLPEDKQASNSRGRCDGSDEIDLVDLLLLLARHKWLILITMILVTVAGLGYSLTQQEKFTFSTSIDVGRFFSEGRDGSVALIEPIETIQAKLMGSYIPMIRGRFAAEGRLDKASVGLSVSIPKGSNLLILESKGPLENQEIHREVHKATLTALQEDHRQLTGDLKKRLETALAKASLKLAEMEDPRLFAIREKELNDQVDNSKRNLENLAEKRTMITASIKELDKLKIMLEGESQKIRETIEKYLIIRAQAAKEANNAANAMTLLMMDNQIQQNQTRLQSIQERLELGLAADRRQLDKELNDNKRATETQKAAIEQQKMQLTKLSIDHQNSLTEHKQTVAQLEHDISLIKETRSLALAVRSVGPVGPKRTMLVALAAVLGGMSGIFFAFGAEIRQRVRAKKLE